MQRVLSIFMALCIGLTLSLDVHAKRFGGGKSFGSAPSHQTRQAPQQTQAALLPGSGCSPTDDMANDDMNINSNKAITLIITIMIKYLK